MGGHGGLNILPQKRWHVYNQDNREKVAKDEAAYEEVQKAKRAKHQQAESEYRHARMLGRARGELQAVQAPQVTLKDGSPPRQLLASPDSSVAVANQQHEALRPTNLSHNLEQQQQQHHTAAQSSTITPLQPLAEPAAASLKQSELSIGVHTKRRDDGHMNFWKEDEVKAGNADVKADRVNERRRRGDAATQTSDARFDERFQLGHAMHGRAHMPWYVTTPGQPESSGGKGRQQASSRPLNGAILLAAGVETSAPDVPLAVQQSGSEPSHSPADNVQRNLKGSHQKAKKHRKERKKEKQRRKGDAVHAGSSLKSKSTVSESKLRINAAQLKASIKAMREERVAREAQERLRQQNLLRHEFRN